MSQARKQTPSRQPPIAARRAPITWVQTLRLRRTRKRGMVGPHFACQVPAGSGAILVFDVSRVATRGAGLHARSSSRHATANVRRMRRACALGAQDRTQSEPLGEAVGLAARESARAARHSRKIANRWPPRWAVRAIDRRPRAVQRTTTRQHAATRKKVAPARPGRRPPTTGPGRRNCTAGNRAERRAAAIRPPWIRARGNPNDRLRGRGRPRPTNARARGHAYRTRERHGPQNSASLVPAAKRSQTGRKTPKQKLCEQRAA